MWYCVVELQKSEVGCNSYSPSPSLLSTRVSVSMETEFKKVAIHDLLFVCALSVSIFCEVHFTRIGLNWEPNLLPGKYFNVK